MTATARKKSRGLFIGRIRLLVERMGFAAMAAGGLVILIQAAWIFYGVVMRYVFRSPDATVTEATALLLFPVAFAGLAYALKMDAYPRMTFLVDRLPPRLRRRLDSLNDFIIFAIGAFFATAGIQATFRDLESGVGSEILLWPRWIFWAPSAIAWTLFAFSAAFRLFDASAPNKD